MSFECTVHSLISYKNLLRAFLQVAGDTSPASDITLRALCFTASVECLFSTQKLS